VAAAVAAVFAKLREDPAAARATATAGRSKPAGTVRMRDAQCTPVEADDPAELLASLRARRRAQRLRKKERRRAAKQAAHDPPSKPSDTDAAGLRADSRGESAAVPAQASVLPVAPIPPIVPAGPLLSVITESPVHAQPSLPPLGGSPPAPQADTFSETSYRTFAGDAASDAAALPSQVVPMGLQTGTENSTSKRGSGRKRRATFEENRVPPREDG
jgi:hypothetical protein